MTGSRIHTGLAIPSFMQGHQAGRNVQYQKEARQLNRKNSESARMQAEANYNAVMLEAHRRGIYLDANGNWKNRSDGLQYHTEDQLNKTMVDMNEMRARLIAIQNLNDLNIWHNLNKEVRVDDEGVDFSQLNAVFSQAPIVGNELKLEGIHSMDNLDFNNPDEVALVQQYLQGQGGELEDFTTNLEMQNEAKKVLFKYFDENGQKHIGNFIEMSVATGLLSSPVSANKALRDRVANELSVFQHLLGFGDGKTLEERRADADNVKLGHIATIYGYNQGVKKAAVEGASDERQERIKKETEATKGYYKVQETWTKGILGVEQEKFKGLNKNNKKFTDRGEALRTHKDTSAEILRLVGKDNWAEVKLSEIPPDFALTHLPIFRDNEAAHNYLYKSRGLTEGALKTLRHYGRLLPLAKRAAELTPEDAGIVDNVLGSFKKKYLHPGSDDKARIAYGSLRSKLLRIFAGATMTVSELKEFKNNLEDLNVQPVTILTQLETELSSWVGEIETIANLSDPIISIRYLGGFLSDIKDIRKTINNNLNNIKGVLLGDNSKLSSSKQPDYSDSKAKMEQLVGLPE